MGYVGGVSLLVEVDDGGCLVEESDSGCGSGKVM